MRVPLSPLLLWGCGTGLWFDVWVPLSAGSCSAPPSCWLQVGHNALGRRQKPVDITNGALSGGGQESIVADVHRFTPICCCRWGTTRWARAKWWTRVPSAWTMRSPQVRW